MFVRCPLVFVIVQDDVASYLGSSGVPGLFRAKIGLGEAIYLPPGWVFAEVNGRETNFGIMLPLFIAGDCLHGTQYISNILALQGKPNADLIAGIKDCKFKHSMMVVDVCCVC